jgi:hypothetical protein
MRDERGAIAEPVLILLWAVLIVLAVWQIIMFTFTATSAENAARLASRVESLGGDGEDAALEALSSWLRDGASVDIDEVAVTVAVEVPIVVPFLSSDNVALTRTAELRD